MFGETLREELSAQGVGVWELARRLSGPGATREQVAGKRRQITRYLNSPTSPGLRRREEIAEALSIDPSVFDEDERHAQQLARIAGALAPLADVLLEIASEAAAAEKERM